MKKIIVLLYITFVTFPLMALVGVCCDYGQNPQSTSSYNYQERYFIECYCNCDIGSTINKCVKCGHYHEPKEEQIIVTQNAQDTYPQRNSINLPPTQQSALALLIKNYKKSQRN